ncbi:hypothetical protein [uncultured Paludibaculum sp.]|uniref:hypothetical protein n=1 Tax=uncultured Paludibaculum sp. TaxID=1765020 RepID=UPI002AAA9BEB|nr:hypothetical protein [uncultured Paludibaculum sp.]
MKSDTAGHTMEILVPADRDLPLLVDGQGLLFLNEDGQPWARDRAAYVIQKSVQGEKAKTTKIQVKGR